MTAIASRFLETKTVATAAELMGKIGWGYALADGECIAYGKWEYTQIFGFQLKAFGARAGLATEVVIRGLNETYIRSAPVNWPIKEGEIQTFCIGPRV